MSLFVDDRNEERTREEDTHILSFEKTATIARFIEVRTIEMDKDELKTSLRQAYRSPLSWIKQILNLLKCGILTLGRFLISLPIVHFFVSHVAVAINRGNLDNDALMGLSFSNEVLQIAITFALLGELTFFLVTAPKSSYPGFKNMFHQKALQIIESKHPEIKNAENLSISEKYLIHIPQP